MLLQDVVGKIQTSSTKSLPMACFCCNTTENSIFSHKCRQRKVHLNTSKKSFVFVTIRHRKFHLYIHLSYTKIWYLRKICICGKMLLSYIFVWRTKVQKIWFFRENLRKLTKILSFLSFSKFSLDENSFFHAVL